MSEPTREVPPQPGLIRAQQEMARRYHEERERAREALMLSLSDDSLTSILKGLRQFREGKPLPAKVRKILEGVLQEVNLQKIITKSQSDFERKRGIAISFKI